MTSRLKYTKLKNNKVVIFDFDCTITQVHVYFVSNKMDILKELYNSKLPNEDDFYNITLGIKIEKLNEHHKRKLIESVFGGEVRLKFLKNMFDIMKKLGYFLVIASDNKYNTINTLLEMVNLRSYFDIIKDRSDVYSNKKYLSKLFPLNMQSYDYSKDYFINEIFEHGVNKIVYFDDDSIYFNKLKNTICNKYLNFYKCFVNNDSNKILLFFSNLEKNGHGLNNKIL
jgi:predicted phosphatase